MKIKITKAKGKEWYANAIGQEIDTYSIDKDDRAWVSSSIVDQFDDFPTNSFNYGDGDGFVLPEHYELLNNETN